MTKKNFLEIFFFIIRLILLMFGRSKNRYFTSNLLIGNPPGAFKDIQISTYISYTIF